MTLVTRTTRETRITVELVADSSATSVRTTVPFLDHMLGGGTESAAHYLYPHRKTVVSSIHGRVAFIPARPSVASLTV